MNNALVNVYGALSMLVFIIIPSLTTGIIVIPWDLQIEKEIALLGNDTKPLLSHIFPCPFLVPLRRDLQ